MKTKLQQELNSYLSSKVKFTPYYKTMKQIVSSTLFEEQFQEILLSLEKEDSNSAKSFKLYLDTVIINMQSKIAKYKASVYFDDEKVKDIENQGFVIPFYSDEAEETYVLLGILKKTTDLNNI
ncbi:MAG: hypothetical protein PHQ22_02450 [Sulfuricurvum sp.]|nr:hypothetical protein [Sulfuricurvum sp.]MDD5386036.1 hypothetical protein [Sulfuricurvum sp.]